MLQQRRAVGNTVSDLTGPRFEPQTSCSKDERVTARPNNRLNKYYDIFLEGFLFHQKFLSTFLFTLIHI